MFENLSPLSVSGGGRIAGLRLEALEDRTTPALVGAPTDQFGTFGFNTALLNGIVLAPAAATDRAFLAEVGRVSVMEWFLGKTEAAQGADPQVRVFGEQLAASQLDLFNQVLPVLARSGVPIQLTPIDQALINTFPGLAGAGLDTQFLVFSGLFGLQAHGLAQTEALLGPEVIVRAFAVSEFAPLQSQLQTGFDLMGPDSTMAVVNLFAGLGGFGPVSRSPFGTTGFGTSGLGLPPSLDTGLDSFMTPGFDSFASPGFDSFGTPGFGSFTPTGPQELPMVGTFGLFSPTGPLSSFAPSGSVGTFGAFGVGGTPVPIF